MYLCTRAHTHVSELNIFDFCRVENKIHDTYKIHVYVYVSELNIFDFCRVENKAARQSADSKTKIERQSLLANDKRFN
jgi:hypothetical protein